MSDFTPGKQFAAIATPRGGISVPLHDRQADAVAALVKLGGTYVKKHAADIAICALSDADLAVAQERVGLRIGHTETGSRNIVKWTAVARKAAGLAV